MEEKKQKKEVKTAKKRNTSTAAATEANRRARLAREAKGIYRGVFMRLLLTDDAYAITKDMDNAEFRKFVSDAIRHMAKKGIGASKSK